MENQEIEVKFYVCDLQKIKNRLVTLGAALTQARTHEINLRFDTPEQNLARQFQVLRLRQDTDARLTFKGPAMMEDGVRVRQEIEFIVADFETAKNFLQALGYQVSMIYEKYRAAYRLEGVSITLDELPYGFFVEIEGPNTTGIRKVNDLIGLDWDASVAQSYTLLFDQLCASKNLAFRDLTFENFERLDVSAQDMNVIPADRAE